MRVIRSSLLAGAALAALAAPFPVAAQQVPEDSASTVGEVVVTAQRREENLQDVPVAVSVVTAEQLEARNVFSVENLTQVIPSLTFRKGTTNVNSFLNIRGIGTITFASGAEPAVSTLVDGVVLARPGQAVVDLFDVERVEVLRGPQGTLFGKNASAGVISLVTRRPSAVFRATGEAGYFEEDEYRLKANVSGPISDTVRGSLGAFYSEYDGNAENGFNGETVNGFERVGTRGKLEFEPDESFRFTVIADYQQSVDDCCGDVVGQVTANPFTTNVLIPSLSPIRPGPENRDIDNDYGPATKDTNWGLSGQADIQAPGGHTLTSITAYREWDNVELRDGDYRADAPGFVFGGGILGNETGIRDFGELTFQQFTQEFRVASPTDQFLEYVVGGYYYTTRQDNLFNRTAFRCTVSTTAPVIVPTSSTAVQTATPCRPGSSTVATVANGTARWETGFENYALFGQATLNFTDRLRGIAGLRGSHDEVHYSFVRAATPAGPGVQPGISSANETEEDGVSGRVGLQFDFTDDINGYVNYARGYKGPAFNVFFNFNTQTLPSGAVVERDSLPIAKEESDAYEAGLKTRLFGNRLVLNAAAFLTEFTGFQTTSFDVIAGVTVSRLINAGDVSTRGVELDFTAVPVENLTLSGGAVFQEAKVDSFICPPNPPLSCLVDGNTLPYAPEYKFNLAGDYRIETTLPFDVGLNASYSYQDDVQFDLNENPLLRQDGYGLLDASVSLIDRDDRFRVSLVGRNLTDEFYTSIKVNEGAGFIRQQVPRDAERYFGIVVRADLGG